MFFFLTLLSNFRLAFFSFLCLLQIDVVFSADFLPAHGLPKEDILGITGKMQHDVERNFRVSSFGSNRLAIVFGKEDWELSPDFIKDNVKRYLIKDLPSNIEDCEVVFVGEGRGGSVALVVATMFSRLWLPEKEEKRFVKNQIKVVSVDGHYVNQEIFIKNTQIFGHNYEYPSGGMYPNKKIGTENILNFSRSGKGLDHGCLIRLSRREGYELGAAIDFFKESMVSRECCPEEAGERSVLQDGFGQYVFESITNRSFLFPAIAVAGTVGVVSLGATVLTGGSIVPLTFLPASISGVGTALVSCLARRITITERASLHPPSAQTFHWSTERSYNSSHL